MPESNLETVLEAILKLAASGPMSVNAIGMSSCHGEGLTAKVTRVSRLNRGTINTVQTPEPVDDHVHPMLWPQNLPVQPRNGGHSASMLRSGFLRVTT